MRRSPNRSFTVLAALALVAALGIALAGCGKKSSLTTAPDAGAINGAALLGLKATPNELGAAMRVQESNTAALMRIPGVVGTAITADANGRPAIMVLTEAAMGVGRLPATIDGYRVIEEVSGKIVAMKGGGGGVSHTAQQTPPIQLGTSGGPAGDLANGFCCGGTLGSLVHIGATQYILSNSHVFAG